MQNLKISLLSFAFLLVSLVSFGQTTLPTSWDSDGNPPAFWTTSGTSKYASNGNDNPPSIKFNGSGQRVDIQFSDVAGEVEFYLKAQTFNNADFEGTFQVLESADGNNFTVAFEVVDANLPFNKFNRFAFNADPSTKYLRFLHETKVSGANIACDDILVKKATVSGPDFNFIDNSIAIANNGEISFEGTETRTITIENQGGAALNVSSMELTTNEGNSFALTALDDITNIPAGGSASVEIAFTPPAPQQYLGAITFSSNQSFKSPYVVNLNGLGGATANEPEDAPFSLNIANLSTFRGKISYNGSDAESYLILLSKTPITGSPEDGRGYDLSERIGDATVVYNGTAKSTFFSNIVAGTTYYMQVFPFNGNGATANYKTTGLTPVKQFTTPANMITSGYYNGVDPNQNTFIQDVFNAVNDHEHRFYGNYDEDMVELFLSRDTTEGRRAVNGSYTNFVEVYTSPYSFSTMSREHTYSYSWMPTSDKEVPSYSDYHNLLLTHQNNANAVRSNYPLGNVATVTSQFMGGKLGKDQGGNTVYEPIDAMKGDAARAQMYMAIAYHGFEGQDWSLPAVISGRGYGVDQQILKEWNKNDPPSAFEMSRNDFVDSLQGNRNPFIDNPDWACYVDFLNMSYIASPGSGCFVTSIDKNSLEKSFNIFPNPSQSNGVLHFTVAQNFEGKIQFTSVDGKLVKELNANMNANEPLMVPTPATKGVYFVTLLDNQGTTATKKVLIK